MSSIPTRSLGGDLKAAEKLHQTSLRAQGRAYLDLVMNSPPAMKEADRDQKIVC